MYVYVKQQTISQNIAPHKNSIKAVSRQPKSCRYQNYGRLSYLCPFSCAYIHLHTWHRSLDSHFFFSKIGAMPHLDAQLSIQHFVYDPVPHLVNNIQILLERQHV